jgi:hypothetical protein
MCPVMYDNVQLHALPPYSPTSIHTHIAPRDWDRTVTSQLRRATDTAAEVPNLKNTGFVSRPYTH